MQMYGNLGISLKCVHCVGWCHLLIPGNPLWFPVFFLERRYVANFRWQLPHQGAPRYLRGMTVWSPWRIGWRLVRHRSSQRFVSECFWAEAWSMVFNPMDRCHPTRFSAWYCGTGVTFEKNPLDCQTYLWKPRTIGGGDDAFNTFLGWDWTKSTALWQTSWPSNNHDLDWWTTDLSI